MKSLEGLFKDYGVRLSTTVKMTEMGFTVSTLVNMTEQEVEDLVKEMVEIYHLDLLMGEKYGIRSAVRAEKRSIDEELERQRLQIVSKSNRRKLEESSVLTSAEGTIKEKRREDGLILADAVASTGLLNLSSKDSILFDQNHAHFAMAGLLGIPEPSSDTEGRKGDKRKQKRQLFRESTEDGDDRPREHPFIVTVPGELARGKKNGLDYLFDLYEQCGKFLEEVQKISRERGEKCPMKVTNQVFRHAKLHGATYINKPKMRHYVHCYALHCLDMEQSNHLRKIYKERGANVGAWRQACYYPLVAMVRDSGWDIEGVFNTNEKLRICQLQKNSIQCHFAKCFIIICSCRVFFFFLFLEHIQDTMILESAEAILGPASIFLLCKKCPCKEGAFVMYLLFEKRQKQKR